MKTYERLNLPPVRDPQLKPCPFCGGPAEIEFWHGGRPAKRRAGCADQCDVSPGVCGDTKRETIEKWNQRA